MANFLQTIGQAIAPRQKALSPPSSGLGGWWPVVREAYAGAWQQNVEVKLDSVLSFHAVYACITLIASDISKLRVKLVQLSDDIWTETTNPAFSPVLRKPNRYQNRIQFFESWLLSKLIRGNTYVLKARDNRNIVTGLYVLNPSLVQVLISDSGDVFYQLSADNLSGVEQSVTIPASEIIHDRWNTLFHPLVGLSPIFACGLAATQGLKIQGMATKFFANGSRPGGILTAPGHIADETANRLKTTWQENFGGDNQGKVAVVGDGLKYEAMSMTAEESQLIDQLKWSAETVCSTYHVPSYKLGLGAMPTANNLASLDLAYYKEALQKLIEDIEACLDDGLGIGEFYNIKTAFDLDGLLRMDTSALMDTLEKSKGKMTVNEQRKRLGLPPVEGGNTVYLQEQDHSLEWLARRDAQPIEAPSTSAAEPAPPANDDDEQQQRAMVALYEKHLREALSA